MALELYKAAVEEYRWQATYNWSRTQYLLAFNAAILAAASAVAQRPGRAAALIFALGAVAAVLAALAVRTQHDYYRAARDRMRRLEQDLGLADRHRTDSTATLGRRPREISVQQVVYLLFASLLVAHLVGVGVVLAG